MAQISSLSAETETLSQVLGLVEAFKAFDADNDGKINVAELGGILGSLGYQASEQDVRAMMQQGDTNRDGFLSIEEFLGMNTKNMEFGGLENVLKNAFEALDVDGDEVVTAEELYEVMGDDLGYELSLEDCQGIIASIDIDGDGAVSFEDFKLIVNSL
ncbi:putative calcium-binding protein CML29 [Prunus yedoensis var. nudiflora]|uniref:Probable calcium-binding protein CML29 n=2 Tax=Prunus TaxID=3754 RepID=A0A6P5S6Q1_PRUAV|nr:probable calcium-binding protein CML29 [Prunus avium]PQM36864.1 putative calcium-binding protein CML29 [Prunus yedoensis var. nudiflora]